MENPTLGIRCGIVARIPTGIHRFDGNLHKIRSDPSRSGRQIKSAGMCSNDFSEMYQNVSNIDTKIQSSLYLIDEIF